MTLLPFLHDRMGFDAIFLRAALVVLCGLGVEALGVLFLLPLGLGGRPLGLDAEVTMGLAALASFLLLTASLGSGLAFLALSATRIGSSLSRILAALLAPLGTGLIGTAVILAYEAGKPAPVRGLGPSALFPEPEPLLFSETLMSTVSFSYAVLVLPILAAAMYSARKIRKTRVNAEAVFGGTN